MKSHAMCQVCGAKIPVGKQCIDLFHELSLYTLVHENQEYFIHQHIVDAYGAQHIDQHTKPVAVAASLLGLYLFLERKYSGRAVQKAHMQLGNTMKTWPLLKIPKEKARFTVGDVVDTQAGEKRDAMITV